MGEKKDKLLVRRRQENVFIVAFCTVVALCVIGVLIFVYEPNDNALGALATVCMDVICMFVLLFMIVSLAFEKGERSTTTKLFLGLMLATMLALLFDFLTWSADGSLEYQDMTYVFTVCSLCLGSVLGGFFVCYLTSYFYDMYRLNDVLLGAKICVGLNILSFLIALVLAITKQAFVFVDGHYQTGALYDLVEIIPILTLLYMTLYAAFHVKYIGLHDVVAVVGYICTMIIGALIESVYRIGATYVAVTLADIFIFVMLQNKLIDRVTKQKDALSERITSQYAILESMAGIYSYVDYVDLDAKTAKRFDIKDAVSENIDMKNDPRSILNKELFDGIEEELKDNFLAFTDLSTLPSRMKKEKVISAEFCHKKDGWFRAQYIRIGDSIYSPVRKVIYAICNIDEEKKNVEKWIRKSNTDELTSFFNRHAYEEELLALGGQELPDDFVYVSFDVNGLKVINDTMGHEAGDELILGACECMKQCFGPYGKLFRTGGDEFVAIIYANSSTLDKIKKDIEEATSKWHGELNRNLTISCGYVTKKDAEDKNLQQIAVLADKRMYQNKVKYYRKKGIDRRGQKDAHVALCELYTKILKINLTDDSYQIVNINENEQTKEAGFAETISEWLYEFGVSGQIHPNDLEDYLAKTSREYMSSYFKRNKESLRIFYRRKIDDDYKKVMMELIPANDYSDDSQNLFLYVKNIDEV